MQKDRFAGLIAAWLVCLALSCAKSTESPQVGTNTNWLKSCNKDAECGTEGACLCGVCTVSCSADTQCGSVHAETRCEPLSEDACGTVSAAAPSACLLGCRDDDDCSALPRGQCVDSLCLPRGQDGVASSTPPTATNPPAPILGYELTREGARVPITDPYTPCSEHADCKNIDASCDGCCRSTAINASLEATFEENRRLACVGYRGAICDCSPPDVVARCEAGRCAAVPRASITSCFSPTQNSQLAYEPDAVGCPCSKYEQAICIGRAALVCQSVSGNLAWQAVEDGPCEPRADQTCAMGTVRANAQACLAEFNTCYQLTAGGFCGLP